jgi:hypothetical protein
MKALLMEEYKKLKFSDVRGFDDSIGRRAPRAVNYFTAALKVSR